MEYLVAAIIPVVAVITVVIVAKRIASHTFICKNCSAEFKIAPLKVLVTSHCDNEYMLECPCCKTKDWCIMRSKKSSH